MRRTQNENSIAAGAILIGLVSLALGFGARSASADATWTVSATTSDGAPLSALNIGTQVILDIGLEVSAYELYDIVGSVNDYDRSIAALNLAESTISEHLLCEFFNPMFGGCINGKRNLESTIRVEDGVEGIGAEDTFLAIYAGTPATGTGAVDEPFPQFRLVYDIIGVGSTVLRIGTFLDYADVYTTGSGPGVVNNTAVGLSIVPEPGTALLLGLGLMGLGASDRRDRAVVVG